MLVIMYINLTLTLEIRIMTIKVFLCDKYNENTSNKLEEIQVTNWRKYFWFHKSKTRSIEHRMAKVKVHDL